jgi:hypothetical protein
MAVLRARPRSGPINGFHQETAAMKVCFVRFGNLQVLAREYNHHGNGGAELQQTLLAKALSARGYQVAPVYRFRAIDGASDAL